MNWLRAVSTVAITVFSHAAIAQNNSGEMYWSFNEGVATHAFYVEDRQPFTNAGAAGVTGKIRYEVRERKKVSQEFLHFNVTCKSDAEAQGSAPKVAYFLDSERQTAGPVYTIKASGPAEPGAEEPHRLWRYLCGTSTQEVPSAILVRRSEPTVDGAFVVQGNGDIVGNDLKVLKNVNEASCSSGCLVDKACKAYSFDRWNKWCFLKSEVIELTFEPSSVTGIRQGIQTPAHSQAPIRMDQRRGKRFIGSAIKEPATSREVCERACQEDEICVGYTFMAKELICERFERIDTFASHPASLGGLKTQNPP